MPTTRRVLLVTALLAGSVACEEPERRQAEPPDAVDAGGDQDAPTPVEDTGGGRPPVDASSDAGEQDAGPLDTGPGDAADPDAGDAAETADAGPEGSPLCGVCEVTADCADLMVCATGDDGSRFCTDECGRPFRCSDGSYACRADNRCYPPGGSCDNPCTGVTCPEGEFCDIDTGECRSPLETLCEPCLLDSECGGDVDRCYDLPGGRFCGVDCDPAIDLCPEGYRCLIVERTQDGDITQCAPATMALLISPE